MNTKTLEHKKSTTNNVEQHQYDSLVQRLALALKASNIGVWEYNLADGSLIWDEQMYRLYGINHDTFAGAYHAWENGLHPDDLECARKALELAIAGEKKFDTQFRVRHPDGQIKHIRAMADVFYDNDNNPIHMIGVNWDVTDNVTMSEALVEANQRYELVLQGASVGIWDWLNVNESKEFWSDRFYELLGYTREDILPSIEGFVQLLHPDDLDKTMTCVNAHFRGECEFDVNYRLKHKKGHYQWFRGTGLALFDDEGNATRMAGSIQDIDQRVTAEQALKKTNEDLAHFAHIAAHDLREPCRRQLMLTEQLLDETDGTLNQQANQLVSHIVEQSHCMLNMIDSFRSLTSLSQQTESLQTFCLYTVICEVLSECSKEERCSITVNIPQTQTMNGYKNLIKILMRNVISNALKYSAMPNRISFHTTTIDDHVVILITNNIAPSTRIEKDIFKPFVRATQESDGQGIGLSICKRVMDRHSGKIWHEIEDKTFKLFLDFGASYHALNESQ